ncbi:restriction endonuclease subunit S [Spirillospora sp. NBC_00431]
MSAWKRVTVSSIAAEKGLAGGPFGSSLGSKDYVDHGVPVIRGINLGSRGKFNDREFVFVTSEKANGELARNLALPGDVVFTQRGTLGQVGIVPRIPFDKYVISQSQMRLRVCPEKALADFIYYQFRLPEMIATIKSRAIATGVPHINLRILASLEVALPPIDAQKAIIEVLGALDDKIETNEGIATTNEALLACQFEQLKMVPDEQPIHGVPITEFVEFNPRMPAPSNPEAIYVDMAALSTDRAAITSWAYREPKSGTKFMNGDTLLARITPCLENGKTGYVDFMSDDEIGVGSTEFIVMRARPNIPKHVSYFLARNRNFREHAIRNMVGSSGRQRVSAADAAIFLLNRPNDYKLTAFGEAAATAFGYMQSLERENRTLAALRDTLLPELVSGRLRVRDAERIVEDAV